VFTTYEKRQRLFSHTFDEEERHLFNSGKTRLLVGKAKIISEITLAAETFAYAILYMGEHNLTGGVKTAVEGDDFQAAVLDIKEPFEAADFPETIRRIDQHFGPSSYSLKDLFKDEHRKILNEILATTRDDLENRFRLITERYTPLMKFLKGTGVPLPAALETVHDFILQSNIRALLTERRPDLERLKGLLADAADRGSRLFDDEIKYLAADALGNQIQSLAETPDDVEAVEFFARFAQTVIPPLQLGLNLWKVQNKYWEMLQGVMPGFRNLADTGDANASEWMKKFGELGNSLGFCLPAYEPTQAVPIAA
jgi:hypothetical protein